MIWRCWRRRLKRIGWGEKETQDEVVGQEEEIKRIWWGYNEETMDDVFMLEIQEDVEGERERRMWGRRSQMIWFGRKRRLRVDVVVEEEDTKEDVLGEEEKTKEDMEGVEENT